MLARVVLALVVVAALVAPASAGVNQPEVTAEVFGSINATITVTTNPAALPEQTYLTAVVHGVDGGITTLNWHIHEFGITDGCGSTGGHYNPIADYGELSAVYGAFTVASPPVNLAVDLDEFGEYGIAGRSIVFHDITSGDRVACGTFMIERVSEYDDLVEDVTRTAVCDFGSSNAHVNGTVTLRHMTSQYGPSSYGFSRALGSHILVDLESNTWSTYAPDRLTYHIHRFPGSGIGAECGPSVTGGHYLPNTGAGLISPQGVDFGVGELARKQGSIVTSSDTYFQEYFDNDVDLFGVHSVIGRSIVVHDPTGNRLTCCTIEWEGGVEPATERVVQERRDAVAIIPDVGTVLFKEGANNGFENGAVVSGELNIDSNITLVEFAGYFGDNELYCDGNELHAHSMYLGPWDSSAATPWLPYENTAVWGLPSERNQGTNKATANTPFSFSDAFLNLDGHRSMAGALLVVDTEPEPTCAPVVHVPAGAYDTPLVAECTFAGQTDVLTETSTISITQQAGGSGADFVFDLSFASGATPPFSYHIHEFAPTAAGQCDAATTGGHYNPDCTGTCGTGEGVGELTERHGTITTSTSTMTYSDSLVSLSGDWSVSGRSIVIHDATSGDRLACCTIGVTSGLYQWREPQYAESGYRAECVLNSTSVDGKFTFEAVHPEDGVISGSRISYDVRGSGLESGGEHGWHIHTDPVTDGDCSTTGGHYNPDNGYNLVNSEGTLFGVGELGNKIGPITPNDDQLAWLDDFTLDNSVQLDGDYSVIGRSVVIHGASDASQRIACCNIEEVTASVGNKPALPATVVGNEVAVCSFDDDADIDGNFLITQNSTGTWIYVDRFSFTDATEDAGAHGYHVHNYGKLTNGCNDAGGHYSVFNGIGPQPNGGVDFGSSIHIAEIGDLSGKHGALEPRTYHVYRDDSIQLVGPFSVMGRSIVIHTTTGGRLGCCTIGHHTGEIEFNPETSSESSNNLSSSPAAVTAPISFLILAAAAMIVAMFA